MTDLASAHLRVLDCVQDTLAARAADLWCDKCGWPLEPRDVGQRDVCRSCVPSCERCGEELDLHEIRAEYCSGCRCPCCSDPLDERGYCSYCDEFGEERW